MSEGHEWCRDVPRDEAVRSAEGAAAAPAADWAKRDDEIKKLRHTLAIYVHAHETGNSVPPHIESEAKELCKQGGR